MMWRCADCGVEIDDQIDDIAVQQYRHDNSFAPVEDAGE